MRKPVRDIIWGWIWRLADLIDPPQRNPKCDREPGWGQALTDAVRGATRRR